jgi:thiol-disulfide isomerase/thioredoxin
LTRLAIGALVSATLLAAGSVRIAPVDEAGYRKLIAANKGKVVLVDFWATWCKPCRAEMPELAGLYARLAPKGLQVITVSADEPEKEADALQFLKETGMSSPAYIRRASDDDAFINSVDAKWSGALPAMFLYDRNGRKVKSFIGETPMKDLEAAISRLL